MTDTAIPPSLPTTEPTVSLIDADQDFARAVPEEDRPLAQRALTLREFHAAAGATVLTTETGVVALVLLSGAVWREFHVGTARAPQLLPPGAIVLGEPPPGDLLMPQCRAVALTPVRMAVLDRRFLLAATRWPALATVLTARLAEQERDLAVQVAISQLPRVDERLRMLMWHLAERWGRVGSDGIRVPLRLTHATLGRFVGARRPTVSLALTQLRERGVLDRDDDGSWVLLGEPPAVDASHAVTFRAPDLFARPAVSPAGDAA